MAGAGDVFLDLALALPIPPDWPKYTTAIIATTVASRLIFTLPFSIMVSAYNEMASDDVAQCYRLEGATSVSMSW